MNTQNQPHPTRTEYQDVIELSGDRPLMMSFEDPETREDVPRLFLEQFPNQRAFQSLREDGRIWFRPEDLPRIIKMLTYWLSAYRECARDDASDPPPNANWGALEPAVPTE